MATRQTEIPAPRAPRPGRDSEPPRGGRPALPRLQPELAAEVESGGWDHRWRLAPGLWTSCGDPGARQADLALAAMLEPRARDALVLAEEPAALDLACGEGHLCHRLLAWGAARVEGYEADPIRLRRARLLREHFCVTERELALGERPDPERLGRFDVVVLAGERGLPEADGTPLATAAAACRGICAIETSGEATNEVAKAALVAGFDWVDRVSPSGDSAPRFLLERRVLLVAGHHGLQSGGAA